MSRDKITCAMVVPLLEGPSDIFEIIDAMQARLDSLGRMESSLVELVEMMGGSSVESESHHSAEYSSVLSSFVERYATSASRDSGHPVVRRLATILYNIAESYTKKVTL